MILAEVSIFALQAALTVTSKGRPVNVGDSEASASHKVNESSSTQLANEEECRGLSIIETILRCQGMTLDQILKMYGTDS